MWGYRVCIPRHIPRSLGQRQDKICGNFTGIILRTIAVLGFLRNIRFGSFIARRVFQQRFPRHSYRTVIRESQGGNRKDGERCDVSCVRVLRDNDSESEAQYNRSQDALTVTTSMRCDPDTLRSKVFFGALRYFSNLLLELNASTGIPLTPAFCSPYPRCHGFPAKCKMMLQYRLDATLAILPRVVCTEQIASAVRNVT
jgi:hypothetical protein